ncbi:hypothetical protein [Bradyrhizobium lablabi]|uniref:hypothetical protein n=1 Tax=Bradyrhizobium lablabi TaxID=722472 RepID=UPI0020111970|nr:hypothetical protein [Bradyrhizobium lablabi]
MKRKQTMPPGMNVTARLLAVVGLALTTMPAGAQQFSADLVATKGESATRIGKLLVSEGKARIETTALPDGFLLVDAARVAAYFVRPAARVFMDAKRSSDLTQMFVPLDPEDPCRQWRAMAALAAPAALTVWRCERAGEGTVGGRTMSAYKVEGDGFSFVGWVDRDRKFPLQVRTADGTTIAVERVRDEPQPAQSFEIPPGARKFDPQALIRLMQHSDAWVAPPASE